MLPLFILRMLARHGVFHGRPAHDPAQLTIPNLIKSFDLAAAHDPAWLTIPQIKSGSKHIVKF